MLELRPQAPYPKLGPAALSEASGDEFSSKVGNHPNPSLIEA